MKALSPLNLPDKELVRIESIGKFTPLPKKLKKLGLAFPKDFKAAVVTDKKGSPRYFVFDTYSFWDLLCASDERFEETAPAKEYINKNTVGWLIDAIEAHLPLNPKLAARLKKNIEEARRSGLIPLKEVKLKLGLV